MKGPHSGRKRAASAVVLIVAAALAAFVCRRLFWPGDGRGSHAGTPAVLVGTIVRRSELPDPETNLYKDCLFLAKLKVDEVRAGRMEGGGGENILVSLWGFKDRVLQPPADYERGARLLLHVVPYRDASESIRRLQQADDIEEFDLSFFWAQKAERLQDDAPAAPAAAALKRTRSTAAASSAPDFSSAVESGAEEKARRLRAASMDADRQAIMAALARHGGSWEAWFEELAPLRDDLAKKVRASGGILVGDRDHFSDLSWLSLGRPSGDRQTVDALRMLTFLHGELRKRGVDLIVLPIPPKEDVTAAAFSDRFPPDGIIQPYKIKLYDELLDAGVEVIDLTPHLLAEKDNYPFLFYRCEDPHPADGAIRIAARVIAERLARYDFSDGTRTKRDPYVMRMHPLTVSKNSALFAISGRYFAFQVLTLKGEPWIGYPRESPILVIGDSFIGVPREYGVYPASLPAHITRETGIMVSKLERGGGAARMMRHMMREGPVFLRNRRVCIFSFSPYFMFVPNGEEEERLYDWELFDLKAARELPKTGASREE